MTETDVKKPDAPLDAATFRRRQRKRNLALLWTLLALCTLFFAITVAKIRFVGHP